MAMPILVWSNCEIFLIYVLPWFFGWIEKICVTSINETPLLDPQQNHRSWRMLGTQSQRTKSGPFLFFSCFYDKLCMDSIVAENTGSIHHITSSITHNTHTESHLGVFGCEMGVLWLHLSDIFYTGDKFYTMSPLVRDLVSSLPTHWGLPRPQQYVLHLTWLVTGHWPVVRGWG